MKYGLIGERLGHSFSKEVHEKIGSYEYELLEIDREGLAAFMKKRDFRAINVTIPYKEDVIPYLDFVSDKARLIGSVNTIVNREGRLFGYNTDFSGMADLINKAKIDIKGKKVLIAGTGGTSKTAFAVSEALGAREIYKLSRSLKKDSITYEEAYEKHLDAEVIINTTPVGMYPDMDGLPIELARFPRLIGVIDAIYNPLRSRLIQTASEMGIVAVDGLYMLIAQGVRASEIFMDKEYPEGLIDEIYGKIRKKKENIVLSGMPGCGKTTIGALLAKRLGRQFIDIDDEIVKDQGKAISAIFAEEGEMRFRDIETEIIRKSIAGKSGVVIATGGGAILRDENVIALKHNGVIYFLDRPLEQLVPTDCRPLAATAEAIAKRYNERFPRYCSICDIHLKTDGVAEHTVEIIGKDFE